MIRKKPSLRSKRSQVAKHLRAFFIYFSIKQLFQFFSALVTESSNEYNIMNAHFIILASKKHIGL